MIHKNPDMQSLLEDDRLISDRELGWFKSFEKNGDIKFGLNKTFLKQIQLNQSKLELQAQL